MNYYRSEGERFIADRWREKTGLPPVLKERGFAASMPEQWSVEFEKQVRKDWKVHTKRFDKLIPYMKNRLLLGACRYGILNDPNKPKWDRLTRYELELQLFDKDHNQEHIVDAMNMLLLEWEEGSRSDSLICMARYTLYISKKFYFKLKPIINNIKTREKSQL